MKQFLIDAFANAPFKGNPACVVEPFAAWPEDVWMQALAAENNQAETAFLRTTDAEDIYDLRWFTPKVEVNLCGHATLASAHGLWTELGVTSDALHFDTRSGRLSVRRLDEGRYEMDFPAYESYPLDMELDLGLEIEAIYGGPALTVVVKSAEALKAYQPDLSAIPNYEGTLFGAQEMTLTALGGVGHEADIISRFFAPGCGIPEDPVTGSMHCIIAPIWHERLGKTHLSYYQAYPNRGGYLDGELNCDRVKLRGSAVTILRGELLV